MKQEHTGRPGRYREDQKTRRRLSFRLVVLAALIMAALGAGVFTFARYILQEQRDVLAEAGAFYFSSDYLRPKSEKAVYDIYTKTFDINLYASEGSNTSDVAIGYTAAVTGGTPATSTGTIAANSNEPAKLTITPDGGAKQVTVSVTTTPYNKPLFATFCLKDPGASSHYKVQDCGSYCVLTLYTGSSPGNITINYGNLAPDNTNEMMSNWSDTSGTLTNLTANATYTLIFFGSASSTSGAIVLEGNTISLAASGA